MYLTYLILARMSSLIGAYPVRVQEFIFFQRIKKQKNNKNKHKTCWRKDCFRGPVYEELLSSWRTYKLCTVSVHPILQNTSFLFSPIFGAISDILNFSYFGAIWDILNFFLFLGPFGTFLVFSYFRGHFGHS
jgi:hypothetical protein